MCSENSLKLEKRLEEKGGGGGGQEMSSFRVLTHIGARGGGGHQAQLPFIYRKYF